MGGEAKVGLVEAYGCLTIKSQPADQTVWVIERKNLLRWLCQHGTILTPPQVETVYSYARRSTTWT